MSNQPIRTPQQSNPDQRRRQARAPYNFVPLPDRLVHAPDRLADHDEYHEGRYTGQLTCTLITLSPLYTRTAVNPDFYRKWANEMEKLRTDPNAKEEYAEYAQFFHVKNREEPMIPGSSLRGMVRSLMEIITYGYMPWVGNQPTFTFRAVAAPKSDPLQTPYQEIIGRFGRNVRAGYLERTRDGWAVQPALLPKLLNDSVDDYYLKVKETTIQDGDIQGFQRLNSRNYQPDWFPVTFNVEIRRRLVRVAQIATIGTRKYQYAGVLVCSGNMLETGKAEQKSPRRNHALILPPDRKTEPIPIDPQALADYLAGLTDFQEKLVNWGGKQKESDATLGCLKEGAPVFFTAPAPGQPITYFGHSPNFRIPARLVGEERASNPQDFVPEELRSGTQPDLPAAIFGWVEETQQAKRKGRTLTLLAGQRAGRVFFSDAKFTGSDDGLWLSDHPTTLHTLGTPKPTTFQHYLVQDRRSRHDPNNAASLAHYGTTPDETAIRGHKLYWHKGDRLDLEATPKEREHPKQLTQVRPVKPGVHFAFTIRFENLSDIELGALLWTLSLPGAENKQYAHKLGMGKPLGMGSVYLTPTLQLDDRPARYQTLLTDGQWHTPSTESERDTYMEAFERYLLGELNSQETQLAAVARIRTLLTLLEWRESQPQWLDATRYMEIERGNQKENEYKERPVLPTPEVVAGAYEGAATPIVRPPARTLAVPPNLPEDTTVSSNPQPEVTPADTRQAALQVEAEKPTESTTTALPYRGTVTRFGLGRNRSFGFILPDLPGEDDHFDPLPDEIFIHRNQLPAGVNTLQPNDRVAFSIRDGWNGKEATQVRLLQQGAAQ